MVNRNLMSKSSRLACVIASVVTLNACGPQTTVPKTKLNGNGAPAPVIPLNDTGVNYYLNYQQFGAGTPAAGQKAIVYGPSNKPSNAVIGQDADFVKGFQFAKFKGQNHQAVDASEKDNFDCVEDNVTHLTWENKVKNQASIHFAQNMYTWFNSDPNSNGGNAGSKSPGQCTDIAGNTEDFIKAVNAEKLCGYSNWRLPLVEELRSIIDYSKEVPDMVDLQFFPYVTMIHHRWSAETYVRDPAYAWGFHMHEGVVQQHTKECQVYTDPGTGMSSQNYHNGIMLVRNNPRE